MAAEKLRRFHENLLSGIFLLVQCSPLRGAQLRDLGRYSLKLPKTADCVAVVAVICEPVSVSASLLCRESTGKNVCNCYNCDLACVRNEAFLPLFGANSLLFETGNFLELAGSTGGKTMN